MGRWGKKPIKGFTNYFLGVDIHAQFKQALDRRFCHGPVRFMCLSCKKKERPTDSKLCGDCNEKASAPPST